MPSNYLPYIFSTHFLIPFFLFYFCLYTSHFLSLLPPPSATHATLIVSPLEYIITWISYSLVGKEFFWMILELWIMK